MQSPICFVFRHLHEALVNIAPERASQFDKEFAEFTLEYVDDQKWICNVDTEKKFIRISRMVMEVLWCISYAHVIFYVKIVQGRKVLTPQEIDLHNDPELSKALLLMSWALRAWLKPSASSDWPEDLPRPLDNPPNESWEHIANDCCLAAAAFIVHHELAHIRLMHPRGPSTLDRERDADIAAADWIMHECGDTKDMRFIKRLLGISQALILTTVYGVYTGDYGDTSHPRDFDRLFNTIRRFLSDRDHIIIAFTMSVLKLHLDNAGIVLPQEEFSDFQAAFTTYVDELARLSEMQKSTFD